MILLQVIGITVVFVQLLVDIPDECRPMLNDVIKLVDPRFQSVVAHVLHIVPKEILMTIIDSAQNHRVSRLKG